VSPTIIAIILGLLFFVLQIRIPDIMYDALSYIGNMNTPFAMLIAGVTIGKSNVVQLFTKNLRIYYVIFLRLLLIPTITLFIFIWLPIDETVKIVAIIAASLPTATMGTLLAIRYNKNSVLAAEIFTVATLLSVLTIPFIIKLAEILV
jgi:predicted permease